MQATVSVGTGPVAVAVVFSEAAERDDVAVVEAAQQLHLQVEVALRRPVAALADAGARPPDRPDEAAGEAGPVARGATAGIRSLQGRGEPVGGRLQLLDPEPPHERQGRA
jgi:hypothetical protein